jgi:hypothetical protein
MGSMSLVLVEPIGTSKMMYPVASVISTSDVVRSSSAHASCRDGKSSTSLLSS